MKEIIAKVHPDGSVELDAVGFKGVACEETLQQYIANLGSVESKDLKAEYLQKETHIHV